MLHTINPEILFLQQEDQIKAGLLDMKMILKITEDTYKMLGQGDTEGVFQLESAGMKNFMKELKPQSLEDIIAGISLYRPAYCIRSSSPTRSSPP